MMNAFRGRGTRSSLRCLPRFCFGTDTASEDAESGVLVYARSEASTEANAAKGLRAGSCKDSGIYWTAL